MATPVYGIFEGGGAKGLGHIAGVKAAEKNDLEFIGVAGASAGALIAALIAVGYRADTLFDPDNPTANLLTRNGISPLGLLGEKEWAGFEIATRKAAGTAKAAAIGGAALAWLWSRKAVGLALTVKSTAGYFSTDRVRRELNGLLRAKLQQHHAEAGRATVVPERICFRDIDPAMVPECCSLKVIVTDITNQRMVVFGGSPESAGVEVAEAVAASISIPLVFKPARIPSYMAGGDALYADGGLVSNLPVWVFAEEKLNFERAYFPNDKIPVLAFTLMDNGQTPATAPRLGDVSYWSAVGRAAIFGGQTVAQRFAADLRPVEMPIGLGVTEFNFTLKRALDGYFEAYAAAARVIRREMRLRPAEIARNLQDFHGRATTLMAAPPFAIATASARVSLIQPFGATSFRVTHAYNMTHDADDRLVFSRLVVGAPAAFGGREPAFIDFAAMHSAGAPANMTKYEYALLRRGLISAICIPIFQDATTWEEPDPRRRPPPLGVVSIDSDQDLGPIFADKTALQVLATNSLALSAALEP